MNSQSGQGSKKTIMNGNAKTIAAIVSALLAAIAVIWQSVIAPSLADSRETQKQLNQEIPKITAVLSEIRDQGDDTIKWQQSQSDEHAAQREEHQAICEALKNGGG